MRTGLSISLLLSVLLLTQTVSGAPKSIMVDASTVLKGYQPYELRTWMNTICENHRTPGSNDFIHNLVVMEIGRREWSGSGWDYTGDKDTAVLDTEVLDILEDYYGCFDNVFVGTINIYGPDPYSPGGDMHNATYRWDNIILPSRQLAQAYDTRFRQRFPQGAFHWYLSYEANLNYFTDATLRAEYAAVFLEQINDFHSLRPGAAVLWSPNFWTWYSSLGSSARNQLSAAVTDFFTRAETDGLNWVHFQDFVGANSYHDCNTGGLGYHLDASNAIGYYGLMTGAAGGSLDSIRVNMELFASGLGACAAFTCCAPGDPAEHAQREADYQAAGVPIGASFELRYWYQAAYGPTGQECNQVEICNGVDDDCDRQVDEDGVCDECQPGQTRTCGSDEGECQAGQQSCQAGSWGGPCQGEVTPVAESCNGLDDDCDTATDEDGVCDECQPGETRPCGSDEGECQAGQQSCQAGSWGGPCQGEVIPGTEECNGLDDDCDTATDEDDVCSGEPDGGQGDGDGSAGDGDGSAGDGDGSAGDAEPDSGDPGADDGPYPDGGDGPADQATGEADKDPGKDGGCSCSIRSSRATSPVIFSLLTVHLLLHRRKKRRRPL